MDEPRARAIFKNITTRIYSKPQKLEAISIVAEESKLNKLTKEELLAVIKWLFKESVNSVAEFEIFENEGKKNEAHHRRIKTMASVTFKH